MNEDQLTAQACRAAAIPFARQARTHTPLAATRVLQKPCESLRRRWDPTFHRIVDIGAGHGRTAAWLTQAWDFEARSPGHRSLKTRWQLWKVTALDVVRPQSPEFNVELFDGRTLPLPDKSRDCAPLDQEVGSS